MNSWLVITDENRMGGMVHALKNIGETVSAAVIGDAALLEKASDFGIENIFWFETNADTPPEAYAKPLADLVGETPVNVVLANDSSPSRVLLGSVAAKIGASIVGGVRSIALKDGRIVASRSIADGKLLEDLQIDGPLAAIFDGEDASTDKSRTSEIRKMEAAPDKALKSAGPGHADAESAGLLSAARIVGVGLGVSSRDDLRLIEDLAASIQAQIACTLPVCDDMRWFPPQRVVGSSHSQVAPNLYIAVGISGQPQHMSGVRDAKVIVGINEDPDARIFKNCDYGILGDLYKIVPELTKAFNNIVQ